MNGKQIRAKFLQFFEGKGHKIVASAPMVIKNDPTLMFTNAGMNQFKDLFLGNAPIVHTRIADTQKCLRVSGKHNDLEEVGHDTYHHTMFEMLGNWSFGDYFKKEAIDWAWELLTVEFKLDPERLYATVFEGSKDDGTDLDTEALEYWKQYLPTSRILMGNKKDNFWEMGASGPCGPCSELHIDLRDAADREAIDGATLVNSDNPLVIEIWNLVFMQFNRKADGSLERLPAQHVDTGMGFERLCMAMQGKKSNYDTDIFQPIISKLAKMSGKVYGENREADIAMRVIADHLRAISFSIADGQLPSNNKAGYVIRRILRRAVRYGYTFLLFDAPFMYQLVEVLVQEMGDAFPELAQQKDLVTKVIQEEEASFLRTLDKGIRLLDQIISKTSGTQIDGKSAFELYDTFGFPIDLTELIAREKGFTVDIDGFQKELDQQKQQSKNAAVSETGDWMQVHPEASTLFVGYDGLECEIKILKYRTVKTKGKALHQLVFDQTPFYAESGGQLGDTGWIESANERIEILDTIKENNLIIHLAASLPEQAHSAFFAKVDPKHRQDTAANHTATHLLHHALRQVLGTHVEQKGSQVSQKGLRFDFSHFQKVTEQEMAEVELLVNKAIRANTTLNEMRNMSIADAQQLGAMALFGEKYGDHVRVIQYADSIELCGGTHIQQTGSIGYFKIISEGAISSGVRRIEAITGAVAEEYINIRFSILHEISSLFNNSPVLLQSIKKSIDENSELKSQVDGFMQHRIEQLKEKLMAQSTVINGLTVIRTTLDLPADAMKSLAFLLRKEFAENLVFVAATCINNKPTISLLLSDDLVKSGKNASTIVREAAKLIDGSGGGQPFFATAGGKNENGILAAIDKMIELVNG